VFIQRGPVVLPGQPDMAGRPLTAVENLRPAAREEYIDAFTHQRIWHRVEIPLDSDVVVDVDARADGPVAHHVGLDRQGLEGGTFNRFKQAAPAALARWRQLL